MTRDTSDWDPLPTEHTGLHPGEAQKVLGAQEPQAQDQQQFVVVRTAAPGAAFGGGTSVTKPRPSAPSSSDAATSKAASFVPRSREQRHETKVADARSALAHLLDARSTIACDDTKRSVEVDPTRGPRIEPNSASDPRSRSVAPERTSSAPVTRDLLPALLRPQPTPMPAEMPGTRSESASRPALREATVQKPGPKHDAVHDAKSVATTTAPSFPASPAAYAGLDPRQQQPWFLAMPVVEQMRLLRAWQQERDAAAAAPTASRRDRLLERFWVAYVVFFVAALPLMLTEGLMGFVRMAMAGCVTGLLWQIVPHTRVACSWSAVFGYFAVAVLPRAGELIAAPFSLLTSLGGAALVYWLAGLGAAHEQQPERPEPNAGE